MKTIYTPIIATILKNYGMDSSAMEVEERLREKYGVAVGNQSVYSFIQECLIIAKKLEGK